MFVTMLEYRQPCRLDEEPATAMASKFGEWLKRARESKAWSGERLAQEVGTSQGNISMYERGLRTPRRDMVKRIAAMLEMSENDALRAAGFAPEDEIRRVLAPDTQEMLRLYEGLPSPLRDSLRRTAADIARELDEAHRYGGRRSDRDENPAQKPADDEEE